MIHNVAYTNSNDIKIKPENNSIENGIRKRSSSWTVVITGVYGSFSIIVLTFFIALNKSSKWYLKCVHR